jgi:hypothetical protein
MKNMFWEFPALQYQCEISMAMPLRQLPSMLPQPGCR